MVCAASACSDLKKGTIPNILTLPALAGGLLSGVLSNGMAGFLSSLCGAGLLSVIPLILFYRRVLGGGDVKLLAAMGALYGSGTGLEFEFMAFCAVSVWGLVRIVRLRIHDGSLPAEVQARFGPAALLASAIIFIQRLVQVSGG